MASSEIRAAEMAVLACALLEEDSFYDASASLKIEDFLDSRNRTIFEAMIEYFDANQSPPNAVNLIQTLENANRIGEAGGRGYVTTLLQTLPAINDLSSYIAQVRQASQFKRMKDVLRKSLDSAEEGVSDIPSFLAETERSVREIASDQGLSDFRNAKEVMESLLDKLDARIEERKRTGKNSYMTGIPSGYEELDGYTHGFQKGDLIILAARPSVGKTALALNLAANVAHQNVPVAFFSLEMRAEQIMGRLLANRSALTQNQINSLNFQREYGSDDAIVLKPDPSIRAGISGVREIKNFQLAVNGLNKEPLYIDDNPGANVLAIQAKVKKLQNQLPDLGLVVVDYLGLIQSAGKRVNSSDNRQNAVADISRALKGMARDLQVPVLALSQLSRLIESRSDHKPVMSDIRDSGAIEQDADMVFMMYRPDYYGEDKKEGGESLSEEGEGDDSTSNVTLIIAKNRNGRVGEVHFTFQKDVCHFSAIDSELSSSLPNEEPPPGEF